MKKALLIASVLFVTVVSTACINNIAVQELNNKANELMQKGEYEAAMSRLEASLDLDASMYETYYNLGIVATKAKKYDKAIEVFEKGIKVKADYPDFYYSLGIAQISYADELLEEEVYNEQEEKTEIRKITDEDKAKAELLNKSAAENLQKYLELNPEAEDKAGIENQIKTCLGENPEVVKE